MPWILNTPETLTIAQSEVMRIEFDLESNLLRVLIAECNGVDTEVRRRWVEMPIADDVGTILMPGDWPAEYPDGEALYGLVKMAI